MTRRFFTLFTTATLSAFLVAGASAMPSTAGAQRDALIAQLDHQAHRFAWEAQATKGIPRAEREFQSLKVKKLIQRLQVGEVVDPHEIDTLLQTQPWPR